MYLHILFGFVLGFIAFPVFLWVLDQMITGGEK